MRNIKLSTRSRTRGRVRMVQADQAIRVVVAEVDVAATPTRIKKSLAGAEKIKKRIKRARRKMTKSLVSMKF